MLGDTYFLSQVHGEQGAVMLASSLLRLVPLSWPTPPPSFLKLIGKFPQLLHDFRHLLGVPLLAVPVEQLPQPLPNLLGGHGLRRLLALLLLLSLGDDLFGDLDADRLARLGHLDGHLACLVGDRWRRQ